MFFFEKKHFLVENFKFRKTIFWGKSPKPLKKHCTEASQKVGVSFRVCRNLYFEEIFNDGTKKVRINFLCILAPQAKKELNNEASSCVVVGCLADLTEI